MVSAREQSKVTSHVCDLAFVQNNFALGQLNFTFQLDLSDFNLTQVLRLRWQLADCTGPITDFEPIVFAEEQLKGLLNRIFGTDDLLGELLLVRWVSGSLLLSQVNYSSTCHTFFQPILQFRNLFDRTLDQIAFILIEAHFNLIELLEESAEGCTF